MTTATDSRASEPVGSSQAAGDDPAAARVHSAGDQGKAPGYKITEAGPREHLMTEIRAAVAAAAEDSQIDIGPWVHQLCGPLRWSPPELRGAAYTDGLWVDLRPSEAEALAELVDKIYEQAAAVIQAEAVERITDLVVAAGLVFAGEHPDAPRARPVAPAEDRGRPGLT